MRYNVVTTKQFEDRAKRLINKFKSLKKKLSDLIGLLEEKPFTGTPIGKDCFKIRLKIRSKGKDKSGGARVITHFYINDNTVFLLTIYDKSEKDDLSIRELLELLKDLE